MTWNEKDKQRAYIGELQGLQRQINFWQKSSKTSPDIEKAIETLRNSQDKLYSALAQQGITAEEVHRVIIENSDQAIIKEIMRLQGIKNRINKQLAEPTLTPEKRQSLENALTRATRQHTAKWDEVINSPDKDRIINKIEQAQIKQLQKEQARDRTHEHDRSR
jgi:hypothetical protein